MFGKRLDDAWDDWIAFEQQFQTEQLAKLSAYPLTEVTHLSPMALGSISRGFVDTKTNSLVAAFRYPGKIGFIGTMDLATGKLTKLQEIKGMMLYKVTSLAFDEQARNAYYTEDNYAFRDLIEVDVDTGKPEDADPRRAHRRPGAEPRRTSPCGASATRTASRPSSGSRRPTAASTRSTPSNMARSRSTSTSRPTASWCGQLVRRDQRDAVGPRLDHGELPPDIEPVEVARLSLPPSTPEGFVFTPDGKALIGTSYYTGVSNIFRFDIASQKFEAVSNASTGFFRPDAAAGRLAPRLRI